MKQAIILLGNKQVGKDTGASAIISKYPFAYNVKFSAALKLLAAKVSNVPLALLEGGDRDAHFPDLHVNLHHLTDLFGALDIKEPWLSTPRELLIWLGTEVIRNKVSKEWHVEETFKALKPGMIPIFTDVRFANEINTVIDNFDRVDVALVHRPEVGLDVDELELSKVVHTCIAAGVFHPEWGVKVSFIPNVRSKGEYETAVRNWFERSLKTEGTK